MTNPTPSIEEALAHYGVPGMKWGHRKATTSGGSSSTNKTKQKAPPIDKAKIKGTPEHAARIAARKELGKKVAVNVLATAGGVAVTAIAGGIAGSAVASVLKEVGAFKTTTTVRTYELPMNSSNSIKVQNDPETIRKFLESGATIQVQ
jgi:hypothetical protein